MSRRVIVMAMLAAMFVPAAICAAQGSISGAVYDPQRVGAFIGDVNVKLYTADGNHLVDEWTTDSTGSFSFYDLGPGNYRLVIEDESGYYSGSRVVAVEDGHETNGDMGVVPNLTDETQNGGVGGYLYNGNTGLPIAGSQVAIYLPGSAHSEVMDTTSDGGWWFDNLPPGDYQFFVDDWTYYDADPNSVFPVEQGQGTWQPWYTAPRVSGKGGVFGKATDQYGQPVPDVTFDVNVADPNAAVVYNGEADPNGVYGAGELSPGTYDITFSKEGYEPQTLTDVTVSENYSTNKHPVLQKQSTPSATLDGVVKDTSDDSPVEGATVSYTNGDETQTTTTDGNGAFSFDPAYYTTDTRLTVSKTGYHTTTVPDFWHLDEGETATVHTPLARKVETKGAITGRIINSQTGQPIHGVRLAVFKNGDFQDGGNYISTGLDGTFSALGMEPGAYDVYVMSDGQGDASNIFGAKLTVVVKDCNASYHFIATNLRSDSGNIMVNGKVVDPGTGKPLAGQTVRVTSGRVGADPAPKPRKEEAGAATGETYTVTTDDNGRYFVEVPGGFYYDVTVSGDDILTSVRTDVRQDDGMMATVNMYTTGTGSAGTGAVGGWARDWRTGEGVEGAEVTVEPGGHTATTRLYGRWVVNGLAPGEYTVSIAAGGYETLTSTETVADGEMTSLRSTLLTPDAMLAPTDVVVTDTGGDYGHQALVSWTLSSTDDDVTEYYVYRSRSQEFTEPVVDVSVLTDPDELHAADGTSTLLIGSVSGGTSSFTDEYVPVNGIQYYYWVQAVYLFTVSDKVAATDGTTAVDEQIFTLRLDNASPNPFNPSTSISFELPEACAAVLDIHDVLGRKVTTLVDRELTAGVHRAVWNGRDLDGSPAASGLYFYTLRAAGHRATGKMTLMR